MSSGYFKVSMDAARAIVDSSDGPEVLAGYATVCSYAYGPKRAVTAAGAKSIRLTTGCTDFRSKRVMDSLRSLRFGERGERGLLVPTRGWVGNASVYKLELWAGSYAYFPSLLTDRHPEHGPALAKLLKDGAGRGPAVVRDALLLLCHVYANVDYAEWFGCPPDAMAYQEWKREGSAGDEFELGYQGEVAGLPLWLVGEVDDWTVPSAVIEELFGKETGAGERFWEALWCLKGSGLVVPVVSVQTGGRAYPLWIYNVAYREWLRNQGVVPDLGTETQRAAGDSGLDPDNNVIRYAVDDMERQGTGLFYCVGDNPVVRTVIVPRLHAPTPMNLDGLTEAATQTQHLWKQILTARRKERAA